MLPNNFILKNSVEIAYIEFSKLQELKWRRNPKIGFYTLPKVLRERDPLFVNVDFYVWTSANVGGFLQTWRSTLCLRKRVRSPANMEVNRERGVLTPSSLRMWRVALEHRKTNQLKIIERTLRIRSEIRKHKPHMQINYTRRSGFNRTIKTRI
uniref:Uncharacterized protein n=1 Tax=Solanum tuberosum TaxID=4113 RepID=M1DMN0_SOLTU